jgi:LysR family transcriptional regulator, transcription activator of glutamate synthase operon
MELRHLRYFEATARHGHVTRAADELHIAQPSLSKQIQALEAELGVVLFDRVGRRVELTDAGRLLLPYARRVLREVADARAELQQWGSLAHGQVTIGAPPTVGAHVLPRALAAFHQRYPSIELRLHEMGAARLAALLKEGTIDLAVISTPFADLASAELFSEELVVAVARDHHLAQRQAVGSAELANEHFILFPEGYELRGRTLQFCRAAGFEPRVALDGGETDTVMRLVAAGLGVALAPRLALEGVAEIVGLRVADVELQRTLRLIWHPERSRSPAAEALRSFLIERLASSRAAYLLDAQ